MKTPHHPRHLTVYDHLEPLEAITQAWNNPGNNPEWHRKAQQVVADAMPVLAHTLSCLTKSPEQGTKVTCAKCRRRVPITADGNIPKHYEKWTYLNRHLDDPADYICPAGNKYDITAQENQQQLRKRKEIY